MAEAVVRGAQKPENNDQPPKGIILAPHHYQIGEMTNLGNGETVLAITFWMTPDKSDPKPLTIAMAKQDAANIVMELAQKLEQVLQRETEEQKKPTIILEE